MSFWRYVTTTNFIFMPEIKTIFENNALYTFPLQLFIRTQRRNCFPYFSKQDNEKNKIKTILKQYLP